MDSQERMLTEFLATEPSDRANFLAMRPESMQHALYDYWASSPSLRLDDVLGLPFRERCAMIPFLIGDDNRAIRGIDSTFVICPVTRGKSVKLENGTSGTRRLHIEISKPIIVPVRKALNALMQFGAHAESEEQRGLLKEITLEELGEYQIESKKRNSKNK